MQTLEPKTLSILFEPKKVQGVFTVKSKATGTDYTFKYKTKQYGEKWYINVSTESGYLNFVYLGFFNGTVMLNKGKELTSPTAKAIAWILRQIKNEEWEALEQVEFMHIGRCLKCNRPLTDADSIKVGLGPKCRTT